MVEQLSSINAFAYIQKELTRRDLRFTYFVKDYTTNKFCRGIYGSFFMEQSSFPTTSISLSFETFRPVRDLPLVDIQFNGYYSRIAESGFVGKPEILSKLLRTGEEDILASNRIQKIRDEKRYKSVTGLKFIDEKVREEYPRLDARFELTFKIEGTNFENTFFHVRDLDLISGLFD